MTQEPSSPEPLSLERFRELVDAYGADLTRMPHAERKGVSALLQSSEAARTRWEEARGMDDLLALPKGEGPSRALEQALASIPERHAQQGVVVRLSPFRSRIWVALSAAAALVLGAVSGTQESASEELAAETHSSAAVEDEELYAELSALAFTTELFADFEASEGEPE